MTLSSTCDRCGADNESTLHTIRDCPISKDIWSSLGIRRSGDGFFNLNLHQWLLSNLLCNRDEGHGVIFLVWL